MEEDPFVKNKDSTPKPRIKRKSGCLSGKGMHESFKYEGKNFVKNEDSPPDLYMSRQGAKAAKKRELDKLELFEAFLAKTTPCVLRAFA
jgi:hypothetical protein